MGLLYCIIFKKIKILKITIYKKLINKQTMATIRADVEELTSINNEITRVSSALKKLREKKKKLEQNIASFLNEKELPGVKCNGDVILLQQKNKTISKGQKSRDEAILSLLRNNGLANAEDIAKQIKMAGKESLKTETIKITKQDV